MTATNRRIEDADSRLQKVWGFVSSLTLLFGGKGKYLLAEVYRSADMQKAYYAQGRRPTKEVNSLRRLVNLAPITEQENRRKVTNSQSGQSKHNQYPSKAIDILILDENGKISNDFDEYKHLAEKIKAFDETIKWGGDWKSSLVDLPHFEV